MAYVRAHETSQRRNGKAVKRYEVVWREQAKDANGLPIPDRQRSRQETFTTRKAADARADELNAAKHTVGGTSALADARQAATRTFGEYARGWLDEQRAKVAGDDMKRSTYDFYERTLRVHVLPRFGDKAVGAISLADCRAFRADLAERRSRSTVANVWRMFRAVLRDAQRHNAIAVMPTDGVERNRRAVGSSVDTPRRAITGAQIAAVAAKVSERHPAYGVLVLFLAFSGLRRAEAQGLEVRDLLFTTSPDDSVRCSVRVERTKAKQDGEWQTSTPKSKKSTRKVPLPPWLATRMRDYLDTVHPRTTDPQAPLWPRRLHGGIRKKGEPAGLRLDWSEPCDLRSVHCDLFVPALEAVGIAVTRAATKDEPAVRGFRLHDFRHTFAALQLTAGVHHMQVSKWLGHASWRVTMAIYADWIPEEEIANTLPEPVASTTNLRMLRIAAT